MSLSSLQLEAFAAVARTLHFSRAAAQLHLTQSALSQRVKNLEDELGLTLFARNSSGVQLTDTGARLLRYCQTREQLEAEILADLVSGHQGELAGVIRVAGYSSIMRSVVLPALASLMRSHLKVQVELLTREMRELPQLLARGEAEFVIIDHELGRAGIETRRLGDERHVLVESTRHRVRDATYLDHDPDDAVTYSFLKRTVGEKSIASTGALARSYLGDIYGLLDGVTEGLGRAVVPRHLIAGARGLREAKGGRADRVPVVLHFHAQPVYPRLHQATLDALVTGCGQRLEV